MKELWKAILSRIAGQPLKPGTCECTHRRCSHVNGKGKCGAECRGIPGNPLCACRIYIPANDDNDGGSQPKIPTPSELEKLYRR